jgi:ABC-type antimicrobial peptide transport system permease subunit
VSVCLIDRQGELAVRRALGAGGSQLATQVAAEGFLLSLASAVLGLPDAKAAISVMSTLVPANLLRA